MGLKRSGDLETDKAQMACGGLPKAGAAAAAAAAAAGSFQGHPEEESSCDGLKWTGTAGMFCGREEAGLGEGTRRKPAPPPQPQRE